MMDIKPWMEQYCAAVRSLFADRILFIGLQGSCARGEANENSDIDVVLILDAVSIADLKDYKKAIAALPESRRICGFISGKDELAGWLRADLFQFYHDTVSYDGSLEAIIPIPSEADARAAVLMGACGLYHACSHHYLHGDDDSQAALRALYKNAFFILQAKHFFETGEYAGSRAALMKILAGEDRAILAFAGELSNVETPLSEERYSEALLRWTGRLIREYRQP